MSDDPISPRSADRLTRAARAARTLSETLWEALLHETLSDRSEIGRREQRIVELSERLVDISATVALLARVDAGPPVAPVEPVPSVGPQPPSAREAPREQPQRRGPSAAQSASSSMVVLVDELAPGESPEIAVRDEREERAPDAWIDSIARLLERHARDQAPFAVLVVELADVERLRHAELPGEVSRLTGLVETALASELRPADSLTRESPGRYWLLAPETDADSSRALAERLVSAVRGAASHRGAPLEVAVGIAVCPVDGGQAAALAAHAEIALYAARADGRPVAP